RLHRVAGEYAHGRETGRRDTDDGRGLRALDKARGDLESLGLLQLGRFAELAQHRRPCDPAPGVEIREPVDRAVVDRPVGVEGCRRDDVDTAGLLGNLHGDLARIGCCLRSRYLARFAQGRAIRSWIPGQARDDSLLQSSSSVLNPPQNMRLPSNGMVLGSIIGARRGSFITLALTLSRWARDL